MRSNCETLHQQLKSDPTKLPPNLRYHIKNTLRFFKLKIFCPSNFVLQQGRLATNIANLSISDDGSSSPPMSLWWLLLPLLLSTLDKTMIMNLIATATRSSTGASYTPMRNLPYKHGYNHRQLLLNLLTAAD